MRTTCKPPWRRLVAAGACAQRPLWASTGVKNPGCANTMYVSKSVIAGTLDIMPGTTLAAFADHGTRPVHAPAVAGHAAASHLASPENGGGDFADVTGTCTSRVTEQADRLKTNGHLFSRSPLSEVPDATALRLGVLKEGSGRRALEELRRAAAAHPFDSQNAAGR